MKFKIKKKVLLPVLICALALGTTACSDDTTESGATASADLVDYKTADGTLSLQYPKTWTMSDNTKPGGPITIYLLDESNRNAVNIDAIPNVTPEAIAQVDTTVANQRTNAEASDTFTVVGDEKRTINGLEFTNLSLEINNSGLTSYFSMMYHYDETTSMVYLMTTKSLEFNSPTVETTTTDTTDTSVEEDVAADTETPSTTVSAPVELTDEEKQANVNARNDMEIIVNSVKIS